jgi:CheY-like chemotaxis protein
MGTRPLVLIVDDYEDLAEVCEMALCRAGFEVVIATDGASGLERAVALRPSLIVLDMMMPRVDGLEFLERLPGLLSPMPPVIAYSAFHELEPLALSRGAAMFLPKPFELPTLATLATTVLTGGAIDGACESGRLHGLAVRARADEQRETFWREQGVDDPGFRVDLRRLSSWITGYVAAERAFVTALHGDRLHVLAEHGATLDFPEGCAMDPAVNFCPDVIRAATALILPDTKRSPAFAGHPAAEMVRFYAGAPLLTPGGLALGTLCLEHRCPLAFGPEDLSLLDYFARRIGGALHQLKDRQAPEPSFRAPALLAAEHLAAIVSVELRRADRDGSSVELAMIARPASEELARAAAASGGAPRLAVIDLGEVTAVVAADFGLASASHRMERILARLQEGEAPTRVGIAGYSGRADGLLSPEALLLLAKKNLAGGQRRAYA